MEHILGGCSDFCLGIWVHQHRTCCKYWIYDISWQRINIWGSRDTSATVTVAHRETVKLFKHACKWILRFYKWPELMWQQNYCTSDTQKVPILASEPATNPSGCLPEVCKCIWIYRCNLIWQFFRPLNPSASPLYTKQDLHHGPNFLLAEMLPASAPTELHWQVP